MWAMPSTSVAQIREINDFCFVFFLNTRKCCIVYALIYNNYRMHTHSLALTHTQPHYITIYLITASAEIEKYHNHKWAQ